MNLKKVDVYITTDSQATLRYLESNCQGSLLTSEYRYTIKQLARDYKMNLLWLSEHCGVKGNEKADKIAKSASRLTPSGLEPFCGLEKDQYEAAFPQWPLNNRIILCRTSPGFT